MGDYVFKPHERPILPGSPATPDHPAPRRIAYFLVGCLIGITGGLGNALVAVNLNFAQGTLGLDPDEGAWLTAAFYMTNVTANLLLVKYRQQFGLAPFIRGTLAVYAVTTLVHLTVHGFWTSVAVRAVSGIAASGLSTLTILYFFQSLPAAKRLAAVMIGIGIPQLTTPLARVLSPGLLESGDWHNLYWFELGLALATLAAVRAFPLPPSERGRAFERLDLLTFCLLAPGLWLLVAVLSQGRIQWWTERAWIGWGLVASIALITGAALVEHHRRSPLIDTRWLGSREMLRLMAIAASIRILLSEQAFGSIGLLNVVGLINDQMVTLNLIVVAASATGIAVAVLTLRPDHLSRPLIVAVALIAVASFMDADASNLTRPSSLYFSQALIGFASLLFLSQAMVVGIARTLLAGEREFISFVVLFGLSQSLGGLAGGALLSTIQASREKFHSHELVQHVVASDPLVAARLRLGSGALTGAIGDPALRTEEGAALLGQQVAREANILAFNDVFRIVGMLATIVVIWGLLLTWSARQRGERSPVVLLQQRFRAQAPEQR
ncbi:MFS transporter [Sphingomonas koreensis]|nr:MFS transporter [Sphingomonas koreensis]